MVKSSRDQHKFDTKVVLLISSLTVLLFSNWVLDSLSQSSLFQVQAKTAGATSSPNPFDQLGTGVQDIMKKLRDVKGEKIPNQYIVVLDNKNSLSTSSVKSLADQAINQGASVRQIYDYALDGFAIRVPNQNALEAILKIPGVKYVEPDIQVKVFAQSLPTGINRVDGDLSSTKSGDGTGSVNSDIGILDTGIDLNHPDLNIYRQVTFVSGTTSGNDDNGHGTSVAGIAAAKDDSQGVVGMAPGARLWSIKVLNSNGNGFISDIIKGIDYVTQHANEIDAVNLSFGAEGSNTALRSAIINSVAAGVTYAAAGGNDAKDASSVIPASYPEVIAVSAIVDTDGKCGGISVPTTAGDDDTLADFSNFGSVIDISAPGVLIKTTTRGSSYTNSFSGTSASTPHVTGAAGLYKSENPGVMPSDIRNALRNSGSSPNMVCDGNGHGYFTGDPDNNSEPLLYVSSSSTPVANNQAVTTNKNIAKSITLTATDSNNDPLTYSIVTPPAHGTISAGTGAARTYTPTTDYVGPDSFTFKANDGIVDSNTATVSITVQDTGSGSCGTNLAVSAVTASGNDGNVPSNVLDNNLNTRWSNLGVGSWIRADLGSTKSICSVDIAWYVGNQRTSNFVISTSTDGTTFTNVFSGTSNGTTLNSEKYTFSSTNARYVRVTVNGNSVNNWASMTELDIFGTSASNSPPVANNQAVTTNKNTAKPITLAATDPNNDPLTYTIVTGPSHGTITAGTGASRTYTPATDYVGPDSFTFKANDGIVDSNTATVSITVQDATTTCTTNIPISGVTASGNDGNVPSNVLDNNLATRWSSLGVGQFITADLGSTQNICSVDIAWYNGNARVYHFVIATSTDGTTFTNKFSGDSSGTTLNSEKYTIPATDARYVRITVNGNTANSWASITELDVFGSGSSPPPSSCTTNLSVSSVTASGNDGNVPSNVLDNNLATRWSSLGVGQFMRADLGSTQNICSVDIAWYNGNARQYHFVIATSTDGTTFTNKFSGDSSGTTLNSEKYTIPATDARYVRITVNGNTANNWASITELDIFGTSASATSSSLYNYEPSLTLSGPGG